MFCFCLQSSLLKLQALEVDGSSSPGGSPEESPPVLTSKEQKSPCGPLEGKTQALCHNVPNEEGKDTLCVHLCQCDKMTVAVCGTDTWLELTGL